MCTVQTLISTAEGGPVGLVEDVIVRADYRGHGIGARLLTEAIVSEQNKELKQASTPGGPGERSRARILLHLSLEPDQPHLPQKASVMSAGRSSLVE